MSFPKKFDPIREQELYTQSLSAWYFKPEYNLLNRQDISWYTKKPFVIPIPPPNVTGILHIGHALFITIQDAFCRYHRMIGDPVLRAPGTDHAGISTQVQVEKKLKKEDNLTKHDIGRVEFIKKVRQFASEHRQIILDQFKLLGASLDREREQFTLSEQLSRAVRKSFKNLHKDWKISLWYRIANRCKRCQTVLSDAEVEMTPTHSKLYRIRYFLVWGKNINIDVYTTRPETIPADVALAVHPGDKRYKQFIGKEVIVPFVNRKIPIIADESVDMDFWTGVLKITPAHDPIDFEIGVKHHLPLDIFALDKKWSRTSILSEFSWYDLEKFFDTYIERLREIGNLIEIKDYENTTPHCERCSTKLEPMASDQWFVDITEYAKKALDAIDTNKISIYPERYKHIFHQRLDEGKPRCISRQLVRWHRIPVWSNEQGDILVLDEDDILIYGSSSPRSKLMSIIIFNCIADGKLNEQFEFQDIIELLVQMSLVPTHGLLYQVYADMYRHKFSALRDDDMLHEIDILVWLCETIHNNIDHENALDELLTILKNTYGLRQERQFFIRDWQLITGISHLKQHTDVLDTWFSSSLWPFSIMWWPDETSDYLTYFPSTLLETAADILFPWVARMIMMSIANTGKIPFEHIYFHGLIRDESWSKMSKSKWNVINPLSIIEQYGTDALRLSLVINNPSWSDLNYQEQKADYAARFITKLRNASRYVWINAIGEESAQKGDFKIDIDTIRTYIMDHSDLLNDFDKRILTWLDDIIALTHKSYEQYAFTQSIDNTLSFVWNNFCDRYIEIAKIQKHELTDKIMLYCIGTILKLLHPVAPFVTDALYQDIGFNDALCVSSFPSKMGIWGINTQTKLFIELISEFRNLKNDIGIKPNEKITAIIKANTTIATMVRSYESMFKKIVHADWLILLSVNQSLPEDVVARPIFDITIAIQTVIPVDSKAQIAKLEESLIEEKNFISDLQWLLTSEWFMSSAPEHIKQSKQMKLDEVKQKVHQIEVELERLRYLKS